MRFTVSLMITFLHISLFCTIRYTMGLTQVGFSSKISTLSEQADTLHNRVSTRRVRLHVIALRAARASRSQRAQAIKALPSLFHLVSAT